MGSSTDAYGAAEEALMNKIAGEIILSKTPGDVMKKWRLLFELSQSELARHMGIAPSVLNDYENNRRKSPGTIFLRKFVTALIEIDSKRGGAHIKKFTAVAKDLSSVILDIAEFPEAKSVKEVTEAVEGVILAGMENQDQPIYGYTVVDSLNAIKIMDASDFLRLFGANSMRALVFVGVSRGRSPLIAVKIYPIKPRMIVIHGPTKPEDVDELAITLAKQESMPFVLSLKQDVPSLVSSLRNLYR
ncbi:MAG: helix-turn-helix domain-containing protein [Nitrososphaerota archaeon]|nr:helix-turn-helix domain-containing protein [Aigarchaeota archaeon]MDW8076547.1 helix-turn-helix domain-containing protein [Nitrososphaerota archaeon]